MSTIVNDLIKNAVHYGHKKNKLNPLMKRYIHSINSGVYYLDANKTIECLDNVVKFLREQKKNNKSILMVGTKFKGLDDITKIAKELECSIITEKWIPGLLTNFKTISSRIKQYNLMKEEMESGVWSKKYTKKEIAKLKNSLEKLEVNFKVLSAFDKKPDVLFVLDAIKDSTAIVEANNLNIPVIAIVDVDADPRKVDFPIPANDDSVLSIKFVLQYIQDKL